MAKQERKNQNASKYAYQIDLLRAVYTCPVDKYGHIIEGAAPTWVLITDRDRAMYRYLSRRAFQGAAYPSLRRIAEDRDVSESTAIRTLRRLRNLGLISWQNRRTEEGDYTSNLYTLHPPDQPCGPLAVLLGSKVIRLHPTANIPEFETSKAIRSAAPRPKPQPGKTAFAPLVMPPAWAYQIAKSEGVAHDLRLISEAWSRFVSRVRAKGNPIRKPGAYFRTLLRQLPAELNLMVRKVEAEGSSPARAEKFRRQCWIRKETFRLLAMGERIEAIPRLLLKHPDLPNLTIWSECTEQEITLLSGQATRDWESLHTAIDSLAPDTRRDVEQELVRYLAMGYSTERAAALTFHRFTDVGYDQVLILANMLATRPA